MWKIKIGSVLFAFTLIAAACGDDGGASPFIQSAAQSDGQGGDGPVTAGDVLDQLTDGSLGDLNLEELANGNLDGLDLEELLQGNFDESSLEGLMESAQNLAEGFADSGSGTIQINGDTINFTSELCTNFGSDFGIEGPGTTGDGTPVWVSINYSAQSRQDLIDIMGEDTVNLVYGEADPIISNNVDINYGQTDMFGSGPDDMPAFSASSGAGGGGDELVIEVNGSSARGSGAAIDWNFVLGDFDTTFDFTFEAACS
jgi:hypothetical protein